MALNIKKDFMQPQRKTDVTTLIYGKLPPQCPEMEEAVIGACMLEKDTFIEVLDILKTGDVFYVDAHQKIFAAMLRLFDKGTPVDMLTITEELRRVNELEMIGGGYALMKLSQAVLSSAHCEAHSRFILEKFMQRELIRISGSSITEAYNDETDVFELYDRHNDELYKVQSFSNVKEPVSVARVSAEVIEEMAIQAKSPDNFVGIDTGFKELNAITCGWQSPDLIILAARPAVGKTAFTIALAMNAAMTNKSVALFSLEMGKKQIYKRMLAAVSGVELNRIINTKLLTEHDWLAVKKAAIKVSEMKIYIDDTAGLTAMELRAKARRLKTKYNIQMVLIDYLQLMQGKGNEGNREQEISKISRDLKKLAMDMEVPIIALSQLNRGIEGTGNAAPRDPRLSDLRESGAIEQDADIVMFLTEPSPAMLAQGEFYNGKKIVHMAKGRNIGTGIIALCFDKFTQRWSDPEEQDPFGKAEEKEKEQEPPPFDNPRAGFQQSRQLPPDGYWNDQK